MPENLWWAWMVLAALFAVAELFTAGFFMLWFGVGAAAAGFLCLLGLGAGPQLVALIVISIGLVAVSRRFADRFAGPPAPGIGADRLIGKRGVVLQAIDNVRNVGRVRIDKDEWRADAATSDPLVEGDVVEVVRIEGAHVVVKKVEQ